MSIKRTTTYFEKPGKDNTWETLSIALKAAEERSIGTILVSSTTGWTALEALKVFEDTDFHLIFVTHQTGYREPGVQLIPLEIRNRVEETGATVLTGTDVLTGGVDVGMSRQRPPKTEPQEGRLPLIVPPVPAIIANTLRLFSQGIKVCVEIAMMAADAGLVPLNEPVISVAGSHAGSDTAIVLTPSTSNRIRELKVHEIIAKPL